jgi:hypothetical protein
LFSEQVKDYIYIFFYYIKKIGASFSAVHDYSNSTLKVVVVVVVAAARSFETLVPYCTPSQPNFSLVPFTSNARDIFDTVDIHEHCSCISCIDFITSWIPVLV